MAKLDIGPNSLTPGPKLVMALTTDVTLSIASNPRIMNRILNPTIVIMNNEMTTSAEWTDSFEICCLSTVTDLTDCGWRIPVTQL